MTKDTYLLVWHSDMMIEVEAEVEPRLNRAVTRLCESGGVLDSVIPMTDVFGADVKVRASAITSWQNSTPEIRQRERERAARSDDEDRDRETWRKG